ncbi:hypothetical protein ACCD06_11170 [Azospirillum sp. CT11-132]|uniref:hypothetical protein n=1 Tax=unclassified Azospirillum TaxID=2630922 RepID=UPI0010AA4A4A|nr:hypothetical protein [Azospirillum sp. TSA2s]QCG96526.1 hypothetical protein E6C67_21985 [Azospirillum sp. TSA2s]
MTYTYVLSGVVTPERAMLELGTPFGVKFRHPEAGIHGDIRLTIYKNQITCILVSETKILNPFTAKNVLGDFIQQVTDAACLEAVVGYVVDIVSLTDTQSGETIVFGPSETTIGIKNDEMMNLDLFGIISAASQNPYVGRALADFRSAVRYPGDTGFFCYRATESLIQHVKSVESLNDKQKKTAIAILENQLKLAPECLETLRDMAGEVRHGKVVWVDGDQRIRALTLTREIIKRYVAISENLASGDFPLLIP